MRSFVGRRKRLIDPTTFETAASGACLSSGLADPFRCSKIGSLSSYGKRSSDNQMKIKITCTSSKSTNLIGMNHLRQANRWSIFVRSACSLLVTFEKIFVAQWLSKFFSFFALLAQAWCRGVDVEAIVVVCMATYSA
jgi:hypothetical protein